jgi:hypothetical protein
MGDINIKFSTIEKSLDLVKGFLQKLVGPTIDEMGLLFADNIKTWRLNNQIKNLRKVESILDRENISIRKVNLKVLFPYLEGISLEEDDKLQDIWANLLVNYIDEHKNLESHVYPEILRQLSSKDIEILEEFYNDDIFYDQNGLPNRKSGEGLIYQPSEVANLERLGLIRPILNKMEGGRGLFKHFEFAGHLRVTIFGDEFYKACHRDGKRTNAI